MDIWITRSHTASLCHILSNVKEILAAGRHLTNKIETGCSPKQMTAATIRAFQSLSNTCNDRDGWIHRLAEYWVRSHNLSVPNDDDDDDDLKHWIGGLSSKVNENPRERRYVQIVLRGRGFLCIFTPQALQSCVIL